MLGVKPHDSGQRDLSSVNGAAVSPPVGPLLLSEHFKRRDVIYLLAVALGMFSCFMGRPDATVTVLDPGRGNLLALMCSITWALTLVALRYVERDHPSGHSAAQPARRACHRGSLLSENRGAQRAPRSQRSPPSSQRKRGNSRLSPAINEVPPTITGAHAYRRSCCG